MGPQQGGAFVSRNGQMTSINGLEMQNNVPSEVITSPTTVNEAYIGSLKAMLIRNKGNYIVATFLIGDFKIPSPGKAFCTTWAMTM